MTRVRSIMLALAAGVFLWIAFGVVSDRALAQCGNCKPPPTCNTCQVKPPTNCCKPTPPPANTTCCSPNHNVYVPGVNVYVAPSVVVNANINAAINLNNYNYNYNTNNNTNNNNQTNNNNNNNGGGGGGTPGNGDNSNTNIINNVITATSSSVSNASSVSNSTATGGAGGIGIGIGNGGNGTGGGGGGGTGGGGGITNVYAYGGNSTAYGGNATAYGNGSGTGGGGGSAFADALGIGSGGGGGGGGQMFFTPPMATGYIQGLVVEGPVRRQKVAYEATRKTTRRVIIQAFCLDDRDVPHPASQLTPDREIGDYEGEIYRCIAGTRLQYVVAEYKAESSNCLIPAGDTGRAAASCFNGGQTIVCNKSDSLYYTPNGQGGGALSCRPQKPARDCNERSLLRRFGAGVKILTIVSAERYTEYREEEVREQSSTVQTALALDGGVGGVAF